jgi:sulfur-oxidizing protein SoxY
MPARREFLSHAAKVAALMACASLLPLSAGAAWDSTAFDAKSMADVLKALGAGAPVESKDITIIGPDIAENGAVVPVAVTSRIPDTEQISIVAEKNPFPLAATFDIGNGSEGYVSTRIKMGQTSDVWAVVKAGGKFFTTKKEVKITVGGCG